MNKIDKNILKYTKYLNQIHKNDIFALKTIFHISEKGGTNMKKMWKQMAMALIGIGTVLSVSACGGKENTTSNEPQTTANVAESEAKTEIKVALWDYTNAEYYKNHLINECLPFWDRCIDQECGGYFTCYDREGNRSHRSR